MKKLKIAKFFALIISLCYLLPGHNLFAIQQEKTNKTQYNIGVIVGSLRKDSYNVKIANAIVKLAPDDFNFQFLRIDDLPLYNEDDDVNQGKSVKRLKADIAAANGILLVTPEYNCSIPGVLKNALDQASRPYKQNSWKNKPAGIIGASVGKGGTSRAQQHLRNILACLGMSTMMEPVALIHINEGFFDENGDIRALEKEFLQKWMNSYVALIKEHNK